MGMLESLIVMLLLISLFETANKKCKITNGELLVLICICKELTVMHSVSDMEKRCAVVICSYFFLSICFKTQFHKQ